MLEWVGQCIKNTPNINSETCSHRVLISHTSVTFLRGLGFLLAHSNEILVAPSLTLNTGCQYSGPVC